MTEEEAGEYVVWSDGATATWLGFTESAVDDIKVASSLIADLLAKLCRRLQGRMSLGLGLNRGDFIFHLSEYTLPSLLSVSLAESFL